MRRMKLLMPFATVFLIASLQFSSRAQSVEVAVTGDVAHRYQINASTLSTMKRVVVSAITGHDGKKHTYSGFSLFEIITKAGAIPGNQLKGGLMVKYVLVSAADNYQVLLAIPEFDPAFTDGTVILADQEDGTALSSAVGPYRLIVPGDKKPARSVRQVRTITVQTAK